MIKIVLNLFVLWSKAMSHIAYRLQYIKDYCNSFVFNWTYLPAKQAVMMPIWCHKLHFAQWCKYSGKIIIECEAIYPKMIRLGVIANSWNHDNGIMLQNLGTIVFTGKCIIGNDSSIYTKECATIRIGDNVFFGSRCNLISEDSIVIGNNNRFGWNVSFLDTNFHYMSNINDGRCNKHITSPIVIGNNNWLGNNVSVSKGFHTSDYVTIGAGSKCRGKIEQPFTTWSSEIKLILLNEGWYRDLSKDQDYDIIIK